MNCSCANIQHPHRCKLPATLRCEVCGDVVCQKCARNHHVHKGSFVKLSALKSKHHELKCWPAFYNAIITGRKTFEIRLNDRDFREGDTIRLREYDDLEKRYSGRYIDVAVDYIASHMRILPENVAIMGISIIPEPSIVGNREHIVLTAGYWFKAARKEQSKGNLAKALLCMENAYNHVENALAAEQRKMPVVSDKKKRYKWKAYGKFCIELPSGNVVTCWGNAERNTLMRSHNCSINKLTQ